jgi:hypothetical protein
MSGKLGDAMFSSMTTVTAINRVILFLWIATYNLSPSDSFRLWDMWYRGAGSQAKLVSSHCQGIETMQRTRQSIGSVSHEWNYYCWYRKSISHLKYFTFFNLILFDWFLHTGSLFQSIQFKSHHQGHAQYTSTGECWLCRYIPPSKITKSVN